jgi:hypothetical protein
LKIQYVRYTITALSLLICSLFFCMSCKSVTGSDGGFKARIIVSNTCGATLDIYMDDTLQFAISTDGSETIENVTQEEHTLKAFLTGTNSLVLTLSFNATSEGDYQWMVAGQATIVITNKYGNTLYIYESGEYVGYIEDDGAVTINEVPFGSFYMEATAAISGETVVVASTTITVTEIKEYTWTITQ